MNPLSKFVGPVQADCPMAPVPRIEHQLRRAAQDLCRRAPVWTQMLPNLPLTAGQVLYDLTDLLDDPNADVIKILERPRVIPCVSYVPEQGDPDVLEDPDPLHDDDGWVPYVPESIEFGQEYFITPMPRQAQAAKNPSWETEIGTELRHIYVVGLNTVRFSPALTGDAARSQVYLRVQLSPSDSSSLFPDEFLAPLVRETLEYSAAYRLKMQPGHEWTDPLGAKVYFNAWRDSLAALLRQYNVQGTDVDLQVAMVPFGA